MQFTKKLAVFTLVNAVIFFIVNLLYPQSLVFGNVIIEKWQGIISAAFGVTIVHVLFEPIAEEFKVTYHKDNWLTVFLFVNTITIYLLARTPLSDAIGIGIVGFWIAIILGILTTAGQYFAWKYYLKTNTKKKK